MSFTDTKKMVFNSDNWFELYYRLGFTWDRTDRETGAPTTITVAVPGHKGEVTCPQGTVFHFQGMRLLGVTTPSVSDDPASKRIEVNETAYLLTPVKFADIKVGDLVAHLFEVEYEHSRNVECWMGVVSDVGPYECWSETGRVYSKETTNYPGLFIKHYTADRASLVAAVWHETEPGHSLYRVSQIPG